MTTPDWLRRSERYTPQTDRDAFIAKSIRSMFAVLTVFRRGGDRPAIRFPASATIKLLSVFVAILLISLSHSPAFIGIAAALLLLLLSLHSGRRIEMVLKRAVPAVLFTALVMLPAALSGAKWPAILITAKVALTVGSVALLSVTTEWREFSAALASLRVPGLFILVLDITVRYIELLGAVAVRLLEAMALRSVGVNRDKLASLGGVAGTLFLKSRAMAGDLQAAMECRGFTGEYRRPGSLHLTAVDAVPTLAVIALLVAFVVVR